jgi:hypothetical protein
MGIGMPPSCSSPTGMDCGSRSSCTRLGASGPRAGAAACQPQETRHALDPPLAGSRASGAPAPAARLPRYTTGVYLGAGRALEHLVGPENTHPRRRARRLPLSGTPPHATACLRVQARQRRPGYSRHPALSRAPQYPAHRPVHGTCGRSVQGVLERVSLPGSSSGLSVDPRPCLPHLIQPDVSHSVMSLLS